jgi:hypothetical protein
MAGRRRPSDKTTIMQQRRSGPQSKTAKSTVYKWKSGEGLVKVGRNVVRMMEGKEDLSEWTDEELIRGARYNYDKNGRRVGGRVPHVVPIDIHQELARRMMAKAQHTFVAELKYAVEKHMEVIKKINPEFITSTQLRAIEMLYDRVLGKPIERMDVTVAEAPWQKVVANAIIGHDGQAADVPELTEGDIIEGEVVDGDGDG